MALTMHVPHSPIVLSWYSYGPSLADHLADAPHKCCVPHSALCIFHTLDPQAYEYFMCTARMDIDDVNKNVAHGIHTACMGGAWLCLVAGFAGMRVYNKTLHFDPYLPMEWDSYLFHLSFKNARLKVEVLEKSVIYTLVEGQSLRFIHSGHTRVSLKSGKSVTLKLKDKFTDIATLEFDGASCAGNGGLPGLDGVGWSAPSHHKSFSPVNGASNVDNFLLKTQTLTSAYTRKYQPAY